MAEWDESSEILQELKCLFCRQSTLYQFPQLCTEPQVLPGVIHKHRISRNLWEFPEYGPTSPSPFPAKKLGTQSMMNPDFNWKHQSSLSSPCHHWNQGWSLCQTSETLRGKKKCNPTFCPLLPWTNANAYFLSADPQNLIEILTGISHSWSFSSP